MPIITYTTLPLRYQPNNWFAKCLTTQTLTTENNVRGRKSLIFVNNTAVAISWSQRYCKVPAGSRVLRNCLLSKAKDDLFLRSQDGLPYLENFILVQKKLYRQKLPLPPAKIENRQSPPPPWLINIVATLLFHTKTLLHEHHSHLNVNMSSYI